MRTRRLRSIVFKTRKLREMEAFFINEMGMSISESSPLHFVLYGEDVRILFMHTSDAQTPDLYFTTGDHSLIDSIQNNQLTIHKDLHEINIIIAHENVQQK